MPALSRQCACPCGATRFSVSARPFARFYCHCLICQRLYGLPYADVSAVWARDLHMPDRGTLVTTRYRPPPSLARSLCVQCGKPAFGVLKLGPLSLLALVPSANFAEKAVLPSPAAHLFWNRSTTQHDDGLPKHRGYWRSEMAVSALLLRCAFRRRRQR